MCTTWVRFVKVIATRVRDSVISLQIPVSSLVDSVESEGGCDFLE